MATEQQHCYDSSKAFQGEQISGRNSHTGKPLAQLPHTTHLQKLRPTCYTQVLPLLTRDLKHCQSLMDMPILAETGVQRTGGEGGPFSRELETTWGERALRGKPQGVVKV